MLYDKIIIDCGEFSVNTHRIISQMSSVHDELNLRCSVYVYLLTDDELRRINKSVLKHDYFTDIITFDYRDDKDLNYAELLISYDRVSENSIIYSVTPLTELNRVIIHGMLHLCGYNDSTPEEKKEMSKQENYYLTKHCST